MRKKIALYTICVGWWLVPLALYGINSQNNRANCVIEYVSSYSPKGTIYRFQNGANHIEAGEAKNLPGMLPVGYSEGCIMHSDSPVADVVNTQYCLVSKAILAMK